MSAETVPKTSPEPVYVVMGNDFPEAVFADKGEAERFAKEKMDSQKAKHAEEDARFGRKTFYTPRVFWRVYAFPLRQPAQRAEIVEAKARHAARV